MKETTSEWKARKEAEKAEAEKAEAPTSFKVPVYASVSRSALEMYVDGNIDSIEDWKVSLRVGTAPTDYNDYSDYMPVGIVTVQIPSKHQRIQAELLAIDVEIEAQRKKSIERLEELNDRRQQLLAIPHLASVE
jgi:hypothetical protein